MSRFPHKIIVDTCFWYALYNPRELERHAQARQKAHYLETSTILIPWPSLYESVNSRFVKNTPAIKQFEMLLAAQHFERISDEPYRELALRAVFRTVETRSMALVDMVIRLILEDINVRKHAFLTFNNKDFDDLCRKHQVEML